MSEHIQINDVAPRIQYVADGVQSAFTFPFAIFEPADLEVFLGAAAQTGGFTVSGSGISAGGTVVFTVPPPNGVVVTLRRRLAVRRTTDFQADGVIRAKTLNDELDYQTAVLQQLGDEVGRAVRRGPTSASLANLTLPDPVAGRVIKWAEDGSGLVNSRHDPDDAGDATQAAATALAARDAALTARDHAQAAVNGVRVSGTDAVPAPLAAKLAAGQGLTLTVTDGGGDERLTIASSLGPSVLDRLAFLEANLALNALRDQIDSGWSVLKMVDGWADEFEDEAGVVVDVQVDGGAGTIITESGESWFGTEKAFDGVTDYPSSICCTRGGNYKIAHIGKDWGAGQTRVIRRIKAWASSDYGFSASDSPNFTVTIQGSNDGTSWVSLGSAVVADANGLVAEVTATSSAAYRYHRVRFVSGGDYGYGFKLSELRLFEQTTATSANQIYDAAADCYTQTVASYGADLTGGQTLSASSTYASGYSLAGLTDDDPATAWASDGGDVQWVQVRFDIPRRIRRLTMRAFNSGDYTRTPRGFTLKASQTGTFAGEEATLLAVAQTGPYWSPGEQKAWEFANDHSFPHYRVTMTDKEDAFGRAAEYILADLEMMAAASLGDLSLVSQDVVTAVAPPAEARLVLLHQAVDPSTPGEDLVVEASRDGGTTWSAGPPQLAGAFDAATTIVTARMDLSGQPAGTAMRWRVRMLNSKQQRLHGVWFQWR